MNKFDDVSGLLPGENLEYFEAVATYQQAGRRCTQRAGISVALYQIWRKAVELDPTPRQLEISRSRTKNTRGVPFTGMIEWSS